MLKLRSGTLGFFAKSFHRKATLTMPTDETQKPTSANWQLALGTFSFAVCFAAWGLISAFAPRFREAFHLNATQTALLVAVPCCWAHCCALSPECSPIVSGAG